MTSPSPKKTSSFEKAELPASETQGYWDVLLRSFFDAASTVSAGLGICDDSLRYVQVNQALADMHGSSIASHLGKTIRDIVPDLCSTIEPYCQQVLRTKQPIANVAISGETLAKPGMIRHWVMTYFPIPMPRPGVGMIALEVTVHKQVVDTLRASIVASTRDINSRKEAEEALQQRLEREQLINKIALRIRQSLDLQDILNTAVTEVRQFFQADRVVINRQQVDGNSRVVAESVGSGWASCLGSILQDLCFEPSSAEASQAELHRVTASPPLEASECWFQQLQIQARLAMPIFLGDQLWGVLAAHQCDRSRAWEPFEVELLEQLATQLAIAIQQSELHQEIQRLNNHLESEVQARTAQLQVAYEFEATLKRITDRVRDSLDEDQIIQAVVREVALVMKVSCCNASLYDLESGTSTTCYEYTHSMSPYQGRVSKFSTVPELYTQLCGGQYFQFCSLVPNPERGLVAMLACPIRDDQGVIGDLWLIHHKEHAFSEQDIRLVEQVANQCAIAIRQARLYEASQAQVKELERLNQLKDDFLSTVSHELRTPLSNMKMAIHMLRTAPNSNKQQRYLEILEAECSRETELINDLLDLQRLENDCYAINLEPIHVQEWVPGIIAPFLSRAHNRQQNLDVEILPSIPPLQSDRRTLERILAELLNNACKYTSPGGTIVLQVHHQLPALNGSLNSPHAEPTHRHSPDLPVTIFTVRNQAEVPLAELPRMFEKFYRIPKSDPWQQGGTGLGLALVKKLVETLKGTIDVSSGDGWTTLEVQLPVLQAMPFQEN